MPSSLYLEDKGIEKPSGLGGLALVFLVMWGGMILVLGVWNGNNYKEPAEPAILLRLTT